MPIQKVFRLLPIIFLLTCGCAHKIGYKLTTDDRWAGPKIAGTVCVQPFTDRSPVMNSHEEHMTNGTWRTNYRKGYRTPDLTDEVTALIVKHLAYSGLFTKVVAGTEMSPSVDWVLSGTLTDFQVHGRINQTAEATQAAAAGFGLIGALVQTAATSGMKSEIKTQVKLDDLQVADRAGKAVWHDSLAINNDVKVYYQNANAASVFEFPDQALRDAVNEMIHRLGNSSLTNSATIR